MHTLIDTHCHAGLEKYEPIESMVDQMFRNRVTGAVLVQHLGQYDNRYLVDCAQRFPGRFAIVALVEVARADASTGCLEPGSFVAFRLRDGATLRLASLGESEFAPGGLAWDGHRAAFAVVAPAGTGPDGEPAYRTSIRIADAR